MPPPHRRSSDSCATSRLDRLRLATPEGVAAYLERCGRFVGRSKLVAALWQSGRMLVHSQGAGTSPARSHRDPVASSPARHQGSASRTYGDIDIPVCAVRYGVEVDGPWHLLDGVAEQDRARDQRLARRGWVIDRFSHEDLRRDPHGFVRAVEAGVRAAAERGLDAWPCDRCHR